MNQIKLSGREIPLYFCLDDLIAIQDEVGPITDMQDLLTKDIGTNAQLKRLVKTVRILGNSGLTEAGAEPDLTNKWISRHMSFGDIAPVTMAVMEAMAAGMRMETDEAEKEEKVRDVVLEEIQKKSGADN